MDIRDIQECRLIRYDGKWLVRAKDALEDDFLQDIG